MKTKKSKKVHSLQAWCTDAEYQRLLENIKKTNARSLSAYVRAVLFNKKIFLMTRNQSVDDFLEIALSMKRELREMGKMQELAVEKLLLLQNIDGIRLWLVSNADWKKTLLEKTQEFCIKMDKIYQQCLQE